MAFERFVPEPETKRAKKRRDAAYKTQALKVKGVARRKWCGPSCVALLCGITYEEAAERYSSFRKKRGALRANDIRGTYDWETESVLGAIASQRGLRVGCISPDGVKNSRGNFRPPTLRQFVESLPDYLRDTPMIVLVTGHYVVIEGLRVWDNMNPTGCPLSDSWVVRKRVKNAWYLE